VAFMYKNTNSYASQFMLNLPRWCLDNAFFLCSFRPLRRFSCAQKSVTLFCEWDHVCLDNFTCLERFEQIEHSHAHKNIR
jgi:hypothetical protein